MRIQALRIENFRCFEHLTVNLHPEVTLLVGTNNVGKSSILDAMRLVLGHRVEAQTVTQSDFRTSQAGQDIRSAKPIRIDVTIVPKLGTAFQAGHLGRLLPSLDAAGNECLRLSLRSSYDPDPAVRDVVTRLVRVDPDGTNEQQDFGRFPLAERLPVRLFGSERAFERGTATQGSDWHRLLSDARPGAEILREAASRVDRIGKQLVRRSPTLASLTDGLGPALDLGGLTNGCRAELAIAATDADDLLRRLELQVRLAKDPRSFAPARHGLGTQSVLLFSLYRLFVDKVLGTSAKAGPSPLLLVEEPEAHLHPPAVRALAEQIASLPGQVMATTHSPDLLRCFDSSSVVRLSQTGGGTSAHASTGPFNRTLREHPHALFCRSLIIVEGYGEALCMPVFAKALGIDLHRQGIEVVNARGQNEISALWLAYGPRGFALPTVCVGDADNAKALGDFLTLATGQPVPTAWRDVKRALSENDYFVPREGNALEDELARDANSTDSVIQRMEGIPFASWRTKRKDVVVKKHGKKLEKIGDREARAYWISRHKVDAVQLIAEAMTQTGASAVPATYRAAIKRAEQLARSAL